MSNPLRMARRASRLQYKAITAQLVYTWRSAGTAGRTAGICRSAQTSHNSTCTPANALRGYLAVYRGQQFLDQLQRPGVLNESIGCWPALARRVDRIYP